MSNFEKIKSLCREIIKNCQDSVATDWPLMVKPDLERLATLVRSQDPIELGHPGRMDLPALEGDINILLNGGAADEKAESREVAERLLRLPRTNRETAENAPTNGVKPAPLYDSGSLQETELEYIRKAISLANKSRAEDDRTHPKVGVVVVKDGEILTTAYRGDTGKGEHGEYVALERKLKTKHVAGATVYTTLEPCTTRGHPKIPCAERLCGRKVRRVVIGMLDPNPDICGKGILQLRAAGVEVVLFPPKFMAQVEEQNREFSRAFLKATRPVKLPPEPVIDAEQKAVLASALEADEQGKKLLIALHQGSAPHERKKHAIAMRLADEGYLEPSGQHDSQFRLTASGKAILSQAISSQLGLSEQQVIFLRQIADALTFEASLRGSNYSMYLKKASLRFEQIYELDSAVDQSELLPRIEALVKTEALNVYSAGLGKGLDNFHLSSAGFDLMRLAGWLPREN